MPLIDPIAVNGGRLDDPRYPGNSRSYPANQGLNAMNSVGEFTDTGTGGRTNNDLRVDQNPNTRAGFVNPWGGGNGATTTTPYSPPGSGATTTNGAGVYGFGSTTTTGGTPYSGDYDLSEYLRQQAAARIESELAGLSGAYKQAMNGYDAELRNIQKSYYNQRNQSAAQDAIARRNFDERAAASGLNSGTAGQADLARSAAYTSELARLGAAEDAERNAVEMNRANAQAQYEQAIAQARANNQQQLAGDLYKELIRVQGLEREDALNAAKAAASTVRYSGGSSGGSGSGTKTGSSGDGQSTNSGVDWSAVDAWVAQYGADSADDFIKANWKALGLGDNQTASLAAYQNHLRETGKYSSETPEAIDTNPAAIRMSIANQTGYDSNGNILVEVQGQSPYGGTQRLTLEQLANGVNSGRIYEYTDKNGKQVYIWNW